MVLDQLLQRAAGTDAALHQRFLARADAYTWTLRDFFWPRALEEAARPGSACAGCAGRMNFVAHRDIPRFAPAAQAGTARALAPAAGYMLLLAIALVGFAGRWRNEGAA